MTRTRALSLPNPALPAAALLPVIGLLLLLSLL
jgi:hypothetical protein